MHVERPPAKHQVRKALKVAVGKQCYQNDSSKIPRCLASDEKCVGMLDECTGCKKQGAVVFYLQGKPVSPWICPLTEEEGGS
jgi:hypothetical protein